MEITEMEDRGIVCINFGDGEIITLTDEGYKELSNKIIMKFLCDNGLDPTEFYEEDELRKMGQIIEEDQKIVSIEDGSFPEPKYLSYEELFGVLGDIENPYPKDIFPWDNIQPQTQIKNGMEVPITKGRFYQMTHEVWENCLETIRKRFKDRD